MDLFDDILEPTQPAKLTKEVAYAGILLLANNCDGSVSDEEVRGFGNIVSRMKLYRDMTRDQFSRVIDRAVSVINRGGFDKALDQFAKVLPESLHRAVFANACDLVLADGVVEDEEKKFINNLRRALELNGDDAKSIAQVMVYKNQG